MRNLTVFMCVVFFCFTSIAVAQTAKGRGKVDPSKKWELVHDASGNILASCTAQLDCTVSEELKRMIMCHDKMQRALLAHDNQVRMEYDELQRIMQECVTEK